MKRRMCNILILPVIVTLLAFSGGAPAEEIPIASFDNPAYNGSTPLFEVNITHENILGGWDDTRTGLTLNVEYTGNTYTDAFFELDNILYSNGINGGATGTGEIRFYHDNQDTSETPLMRISFDQANISPSGLGGYHWISSNNVTVSGSEINGTLTDESFTFGFAHQQPLESDEGYTATGNFALTAVPEPATVILLGLGTVFCVPNRKNKQKASK